MPTFHQYISGYCFHGEHAELQSQVIAKGEAALSTIDVSSLTIKNKIGVLLLIVLKNPKVSDPNLHQFIINTLKLSLEDVFLHSMSSGIINFFDRFSSIYFLGELNIRTLCENQARLVECLLTPWPRSVPENFNNYPSPFFTFLGSSLRYNSLITGCGLIYSPIVDLNTSHIELLTLARGRDAIIMFDRGCVLLSVSNSPNAWKEARDFSLLNKLLLGRDAVLLYKNDLYCALQSSQQVFRLKISTQPASDVALLKDKFLPIDAGCSSSYKLADAEEYKLIKSLTDLDLNGFFLVKQDENSSREIFIEEKERDELFTWQSKDVEEYRLARLEVLPIIQSIIGVNKSLSITNVISSELGAAPQLITQLLSTDDQKMHEFNTTGLSFMLSYANKFELFLRLLRANKAFERGFLMAPNLIQGLCHGMACNLELMLSDEVSIDFFKELLKIDHFKNQLFKSPIFYKILLTSEKYENLPLLIQILVSPLKIESILQIFLQDDTFKKNLVVFPQLVSVLFDELGDIQRISLFSLLLGSKEGHLFLKVLFDDERIEQEIIALPAFLKLFTHSASVLDIPVKNSILNLLFSATGLQLLYKLMHHNSFATSAVERLLSSNSYNQSVYLSSLLANHEYGHNIFLLLMQSEPIKQKIISSPLSLAQLIQTSSRPGGFCFIHIPDFYKQAFSFDEMKPIANELDAIILFKGDLYYLDQCMQSLELIPVNPENKYAINLLQKRCMGGPRLVNDEDIVSRARGIFQYTQTSCLFWLSKYEKFSVYLDEVIINLARMDWHENSHLIPMFCTTLITLKDRDDGNQQNALYNLLVNPSSDSYITQRIMSKPQLRQVVLMVYFGLNRYSKLNDSDPALLEQLFAMTDSISFIHEILQTDEGFSLIKKLFQYNQLPLLRCNDLKLLFATPEIQQLIRMRRIQTTLFLWIALEDINSDVNFRYFLSHTGCCPWTSNQDGYFLLDYIQRKNKEDEIDLTEQYRLITLKLKDYLAQLSADNLVVNLEMVNITIAAFQQSRKTSDELSSKPIAKEINKGAIDISDLFNAYASKKSASSLEDQMKHYILQSSIHWYNRLFAPEFEISELDDQHTSNSIGRTPKCWFNFSQIQKKSVLKAMMYDYFNLEGQDDETRIAPYLKRLPLYNRSIWNFLVSNVDGVEVDINRCVKAIDGPAVIRYCLEHHSALHLINVSKFYRLLNDDEQSFFSMLVSDPFHMAWLFNVEFKVYCDSQTGKVRLQIQALPTTGSIEFRRILRVDEHIHSQLCLMLHQSGSLYFWLFYFQNDPSRKHLYEAISAFLMASVEVFYSYDSLMPLLDDMLYSKATTFADKELIYAFLVEQLNQQLHIKPDDYWQTASYLVDLKPEIIDTVKRDLASSPLLQQSFHKPKNEHWIQSIFLDENTNPSEATFHVSKLGIFSPTPPTPLVSRRDIKARISYV